jgi:tryptophan synthase alpha chain
LNGDRVRSAFREGRTALVPYLTGGYPTLEGAREVGEAYLETGTDVLEIGVPFSDPLADGPTIQETTTRALANGADLDYCLDLASVFSGRVPVVFLLYYNVIFARGSEQFLQEAAEAGVSGLVIPDLPVDEAGQFAQMAAAAGVAFELLRRVRARTDAPVALGFGIGSAEAAVEAAQEADGIVIGSKLMRLVEEGGAERAGGWLREVREALSGVVKAGG